ncbi:MAG: glycyl-radical enzyme activating protein [Clostridiaceae bacterium]|nr:glycyl-radical enzyme activating protein [Clostridiaceae bacterium]
MTGLIFNVKRFAVHDGPGIRTTLFLKGCPLKCKWCHNPEGLSPCPQLAYYSNRCVQCGECARICRSGAHIMTIKGHAFDFDKCVACGNCELVCLGETLKFFGRQISVNDALDLVLEDREFYIESGGVTLSGGEPLLQIEFCSELLAALKSKGIHTAVDTCGELPWINFKQIMPYTDLFLYDIKHSNAKKHQEGTGVSNERILENLYRLSESDAAIEIRMPLIPGFNDDADNLNKTGEIISGLRGISAVKILPYHFYAQTKYSALGLNRILPNDPVPSEAKLMATEIIEKFGLKVSY